MKLRLLGNIWHAGHMHCAGELVDLPDADADRLVYLGVACPVSGPAKSDKPKLRRKESDKPKLRRKESDKPKLRRKESDKPKLRRKESEVRDVDV